MLGLSMHSKGAYVLSYTHSSGLAHKGAWSGCGLMMKSANVSEFYKTARMKPFTVDGMYLKLSPQVF